MCDNRVPVRCSNLPWAVWEVDVDVFPQMLLKMFPFWSGCETLAIAVEAGQFKQLLCRGRGIFGEYYLVLQDARDIFLLDPARSVV